MYDSDRVSADSERTAFRKAEKKYKLYFDDASKSSKKYLNFLKKKQPKAVDLSEVIDFNSILQSYYQNAELPPGILAHSLDYDLPVFCLENRPGFYFIPGALSTIEQCQWIRESLISFPQSPNRTNHNAIYGPICDLFIAAKERRVLVEDKKSIITSDSEHEPSISNGISHGWLSSEEYAVYTQRNICKSVSASILLRKLRWSTLGLQFDWSKRNYDVSLPHNKIPNSLCNMAKRMAVPAMPSGEEFKPEAAIVNYFASGDTLGGHLDDMEADWSKPIVSMSLGCKAIFLLGGKSRVDPPLAMFLRSGDVVLMAGEARECFHGVPRIFTDEESAEITHLEKHFSNQEDQCFLEYIKDSRININIRQVF